MPESEKTKLIVWVRLFLGFVLFAGMVYLHAVIKELNLLLFAIPSFLMGVDVEKIMRIFKK